MTPKEKAKELFDSMFDEMPHPSTTNAETYIISKRCAIVTVNKIIEAIDELECKNSKYDYWVEVQQEIENL